MKIDPNELLTLICPDLTEEGGIRTDQDALTKLSGYVTFLTQQIVKNIFMISKNGDIHFLFSLFPLTGRFRSSVRSW
jgi:hypothetical protein